MRRITLAVAAFSVTLSATATTAKANNELCGGQLFEADGRHVLHVAETDATCPWSFTVPRLIFACETRNGYGEIAALLVLTEDGEKYALNGVARTWLKLDPLTPIWKTRSDIPDARVDISPWLKAAKTTCRP